MFKIDKSCKIHPTAQINVKSGYIGAGAIIKENVVIEGEKVEIGREAFIDRNATIGGGSCYDPNAFLKAGDWLHMGSNSQINTARGVVIGNEVGVGIDTKIFSHGAYIDSFYLGAPAQWDGVEIGDNVWLPNAWINPGVKIGSNVVVAARSLISTDIQSGSLAAGTPAKVIKKDYLPNVLSKAELDIKFHELVTQVTSRLSHLKYAFELNFNAETGIVCICTEKSKAVFDVKNKRISGDVSEASKVLKDQLRRNGVRFRYEEKNQKWASWC